jgi:HK97 gp10 family phage protein
MADGFNWDGDDPYDLADQLERLGEVLVEELDAAARDIGLKIEAGAKRRAPVDTGTLRGSIASDTAQTGPHEVTVYAGSNTEYAAIVELGRGPIEAKGDGYLRFEVDGEVLYRKRVGPAAPKPYLRPAVEAAKPYIRERVDEAVENTIDRVS